MSYFFNENQPQVTPRRELSKPALWAIAIFALACIGDAVVTLLHSLQPDPLNEIIHRWLSWQPAPVQVVVVGIWIGPGLWFKGRQLRREFDRERSRRP